MNWFHGHAVARRSGIARFLIWGSLSLLLLAFFRVQVLGSSRYRLQSRLNRLRPIPISAARGLITDRNGKVLAENVPGYSVGLIAPSSDYLRAYIKALSPYLRLDSAAVEATVRRFQRRPYEPVVVSRGTPFDLISRLEERRLLIPGLVIQAEPKRRYPYGPVTAHLVGYVDEITERELGSAKFAGVQLGTLVGRDGLEREYDDELRGEDGVRYVEVDARGRTVPGGAVGSGQEPRQGRTVQSTIDVDLQEYIANAFPGGARGAVMAMDPRSGDVLAVFSSPSYDPNAFIGGIDPQLWTSLRRSDAHPMINRAIQARYPPASPWKLAIAAMALRRGIVTLDSRMPIPCRGGMPYYNRYFQCWKKDGHGDVTLAEAIQFSCDVFFYQLGLKLDLNNLLQDGVSMGFNQRSGVDLPGEIPPAFPASTAYYNRLYGPRGWTRAVTLNLAIGQGENSQTLSNMTRFYAMLANASGTAPTPSVVAKTSGGIRSLGISDSALAGLRHALLMVVEQGTAAASRIADLKIAGKTGTAQNSHGPDHGWFIGFAPVDSPRVVVGAIVEFAQHGTAVAPLVNRVIERHLLGPGAERALDYRMILPADSAPEPVPIMQPDTTVPVPPIGGRGEGREGDASRGPR